MSLVHAAAFIAGFYIFCAVMAEGGLYILGVLVALFGPACILWGILHPGSY